MPELPEVETIVNDLKKEIVGLFFVDLWTDAENIIKKNSVSEFTKKIINKKIINVKRRGKIILIYLEDGTILLIHQKISGHLLLGKWKFEENQWIAPPGPLKEDPMNKYLHIVINLSDGRQLSLSDPRKFAKMEIIKDDVIDIGPEPLEIDYETFRELFRKKRGKIKQLLMKQEFIVGIGNIYASEILFLSKIHPEEEVSKLGEEDFKNIFKNMVFILKESIRLRGDSFSDFRTIYGEKGAFQNIMKVYQKNGQPCFNCNTKIERINLGGRGTFFCPNCQKKK
ncbi:MAG: bifunctional DNA-formamidopyrimidine glycosylase/DNA-(apurinic or apyrimidinic site) lyase [Candidatus Paceibacterota bacterium]|jgi:formamidopyrimidine-DNA glycosylase